MSKKTETCYFCLQPESTEQKDKAAVFLYDSYHVCESCVPLLQNLKQDESLWKTIVSKAADEQLFNKEFQEAVERQKEEKKQQAPDSNKSQWETTQTTKEKKSKISKNAALKELGQRLKDKVKEQDHVIDSIVPKVMIHNLGIEKTRPLSFFFAGPTGVGKTEVSVQLAEQLNIEYFKADMSEYKHSHNISRLIGSPPSYVGYGKATPLEKLSGKKCVIVLDEIEKAHPDVYDIFLQVLDKGVLTTGGGKELDLKEAIIIFTSNLGSSEVKDKKHEVALVKTDTPESRTDIYLQAIMNHFRPEMVNRFGAIMVFNSLTPEGINSIYSKFFNELNEKLEKAHGVSVEASDTLKNHILKEGYSPENGARPLDKTIQKHILEVVATEILLNEQENCVFTLDFKEGKVVVDSVTEKPQEQTT